MNFGNNIIKKLADRIFKRSYNEASSDWQNEDEPHTSIIKTGDSQVKLIKPAFQDLCTDVILEIFQYLHPIDLLNSFIGLYLHLDSLLEPYTHTIDFRLISKSSFQLFTQSTLPCFSNNVRVLRLSNAYTFGQINEALHRIVWSKIDQLESLAFDHIGYDELVTYIHNIHPLLKCLWRISFTFKTDDKLIEKLLLDEILLPKSRPQSLKYCFITGITFDLSKYVTQKVNENLRELTVTLARVNDLIVLFRSVPNLEILTCTILDDVHKECSEQIPSLNSLTILTLTIEKSILFSTLQNILMPQNKLQQLSLRIILYNEVSSKSTNHEIGGLALEKLFRMFTQLRKLQFYIRHMLHNVHGIGAFAPDYLYQYSFTSRFWLDRSIQVFTHFVHQHKQRYIYTLPFAFDTFDIVDDVDLFFSIHYPYYYANVRYLLLLTLSNLDELTYSQKIIKLFPNVQTITFLKHPTSDITMNTLNRHKWTLKKSAIDDSHANILPCIYVRNYSKTTRFYFQTLNLSDSDHKDFAKRIRYLTIYEMTQQQSTYLSCFPYIRTLTLHVDTLHWFFSSSNCLYHLLTDMKMLCSLTVYYPKSVNNQVLLESLANTLLNVKKHFFIKCNDGILNIWC